MAGFRARFCGQKRSRRKTAFCGRMENREEFYTGMGTIWGYARCSTNDTKQDINRQVRELREMGADTAHTYTEYEHATRTDRPELTKLMAAVQPGDTICATELSRLTRSTRHLIDLMDWAQGKKICLRLGAMVVDCRKNELDPYTAATLTIIGAIAQMEREVTVQRVRSGMANARAKGVHIGRRQTTAEDVPASFRRNYERYKNGEVSFIDCCRMAQVGKTSGYKYKKLLDEERA